VLEYARLNFQYAFSTPTKLRDGETVWRNSFFDDRVEGFSKLRCGYDGIRECFRARRTYIAGWWGV
jgi:hypothetical protein